MKLTETRILFRKWKQKKDMNLLDGMLVELMKQIGYSESETFYVSGLAFYEKDKNDGYVTFEATFKEKEVAVEKKDAELRVHYVDVNSDNYIKDNIQTIKKEW